MMALFGLEVNKRGFDRQAVSCLRLYTRIFSCRGTYDSEYLIRLNPHNLRIRFSRRVAQTTDCSPKTPAYYTFRKVLGATGSGTIIVQMSVAAHKKQFPGLIWDEKPLSSCNLKCFLYFGGLGHCKPQFPLFPRFRGFQVPRHGEIGLNQFGTGFLAPLLIDTEKTLEIS